MIIERRRRRLRRRALDQMLHGEMTPADFKLLNFNDAVADRVLERVMVEHGSGALLELLLAIPWLDLLRFILDAIEARKVVRQSAGLGVEDDDE